MSAVLADTHALVWYLFAPTTLSPAADQAFSDAIDAGDVIYASTISAVEVRYLVEKGRLTANAFTDLLTALRDPAIPVEAVPVDLDIVAAMEQVPRQHVPDLPDRIVAATALSRGLPLITRDQKIRALALKTIW